MVVMGRVVAPYGVCGWIKIVPDTEIIDGLLDYSHWWLGKGSQWRKLLVENAKMHNDVLLAQLEGISNRDLAFVCKGQQIAVPRDALPAPRENEFYWSDLIGSTVVNTQGVNFGKVINVFATGANDVLVVKESKVERLIPFTHQAIVEVNLEVGEILVDWDADF